MKNNILSVKKSMKNLILRTLRQLYAVSEIIILTRWVAPPQRLKIFNLSFSSIFFSNSSTLQILHFRHRFSSLTIHIYIYEFMSSTAFTYSYFFKLDLFLLSECDRTLPLY